jgi:hypothetical protein
MSSFHVVMSSFLRPEQPQQQYDENTERVAGMRRLVEDDG